MTLHLAAPSPQRGYHGGTMGDSKIKYEPGAERSPSPFHLPRPRPTHSITRDIDRPISTSPVPSFKGTDHIAVNDLHWFTTADDLVEAAKQAGVELVRKDVTFAEHKVNGKTKGSVMIDCHSTEEASMIVNWLHNHDFQGKKLTPSFVNPVNFQFKPSTPAPSNHRPALSTAALLAHGPTNAHGGINFNRVRHNTRGVHSQAAPASSGLGWPSGMQQRDSPGGLNRHAPVMSDNDRLPAIHWGHRTVGTAFHPHPQSGSFMPDEAIRGASSDHPFSYYAHQYTGIFHQ